MLSVLEVTTAYQGLVAISAVSIEVAKGEIVCVAGANGAGKSTLLKTIAGAERPRSGAVILIPLTELTRSFIGGSGRGVDLIVYGALIVLISLARPQGLVGLFSVRRKEAIR